MMPILIMLVYFVIACFVTVCVEKIFGKEFEDDEDNIAPYMIGMLWIVLVPFMLCTFGLYYLGKFLCKKFRKLLNVNQC